MATIPIQTAKATKKNFLLAYGCCISAVKELLKKSRLDYVVLNYDILEPRCYNVNNTSGEYNCCLIVKVAIDRMTDSVVVYDDSNNEYNIGSDEDGQDGYTLVNPDVLISKVADSIEIFYKTRQVACSEYTSYHLMKAIKEFMGEEGVSFENGFPKPRLQNNETVYHITAKEVKTIETGTEHLYWLKSLRTRELRALVDALNEYSIFLYNNVWKTTFAR